MSHIHKHTPAVLWLQFGHLATILHLWLLAASWSMMVIAGFWHFLLVSSNTNKQTTPQGKLGSLNNRVLHKDHVDSLYNCCKHGHKIGSIHWCFYLWLQQLTMKIRILIVVINLGLSVLLITCIKISLRYLNNVMQANIWLCSWWCCLFLNTSFNCHVFLFTLPPLVTLYCLEKFKRSFCFLLSSI